MVYMVRSMRLGNKIGGQWRRSAGRLMSRDHLIDWHEAGAATTRHCVTAYAFRSLSLRVAATWGSEMHVIRHSICVRNRHRARELQLDYEGGFRDVEVFRIAEDPYQLRGTVQSTEHRGTLCI